MKVSESQPIMVPLSGRGIERLMREVEDWKNWLQERTTVFLDRMAQEGMEVTSAKFSQAVYDGTNDVVVSAEYRGENARAIVAVGKAVLFIEFGTGVTYPDNHPEAGELGMKRTVRVTASSTPGVITATPARTEC